MSAGALLSREYAAKHSQRGYPKYRTDATRSEGDLLGLSTSPLTPRHRIWAQAQRDVLGLHRLLHYIHHFVAESLQICLLPELGREGLQGLPGVVLASVETTVDETLYAGSQGVEQGSDQEG